MPMPTFPQSRTPLGTAFGNLGAALAVRPTDAQQQYQALQLQQAQQAQQDAAQKQSGLSQLGTMLADPNLQRQWTANPTQTEGPVSVTPIADAFKPKPVDYGAMSAAALKGGVSPENLSKFVLFNQSNTAGATSPLTANAQVGSGEGYSSTAPAFNATEDNKLATNAATNATSRANNSANVAKDLQVERMKEAHEQNAVSPEAVQFGVQYFKTFGQLPPTARGKDLQSAIMAAIYQDMHPPAGGAPSGTPAPSGNAPAPTGDTPGFGMKDALKSRNAVAAQHGAAGQLGKTQAQTQVNEQTVNGSIGILDKLLDKGAAGPSGITSLNDLSQWVGRQSNNPDAVNFQNAINTISNEYARVMTGTTNGTPSSDAARNEAAQRLLLGYNAGTLRAATQQMQQEMRVRTQAQTDALSSLTGGQYGGVGAPTPPTQGGHEKWVRGPNGQLQKAQ